MPEHRIRVGVSTASVWPQSATSAFHLARELGYDGVEVMVWADPISQDPVALRRRSRQTGVPVLAVHAPCLLITQRIWSPKPEERLRRSVQAAQDLDAPTVVIHPPFRWQKRYAEGFAEQVASLEDESGVAIAVENMFPVRRFGGEMSAFHPSIDPTDVDYRNYTLDLSHTAASGADALAMAARMGDGLIHLHLADGTGAPRDEHLVPGRGAEPCAQVCEWLADGERGSAGARQVIVEINTRRARGQADRAKDLAEALLFARLHLGQ